MNPSHIIPIGIIIIFGILAVYRIGRLLSGSAPRRTKMITVISTAGGIIIVLVLIGLQIFHVI